MNTDRFKFRIWHDRQGMIYPDGTFIRVSQDKVMKLDPSIEESRYFIMPLQDYDIMQCTGLKDIEGKLIYEGDILYYKGYEEPIFWASSEKGYDIDGWLCEHFSPINNQCQIIGNIYEGIQK